MTVVQRVSPGGNTTIGLYTRDDNGAVWERIRTDVGNSRRFWDRRFVASRIRFVRGGAEIYRENVPFCPILFHSARWAVGLAPGHSGLSASYGLMFCLSRPPFDFPNPFLAGCGDPWSSVKLTFSGEDEEDLNVRDTLTHPARGRRPLCTPPWVSLPTS